MLLTDDALGRLDLPVLFVHGMDDHIIPPERTFHLAWSVRGSDAMMLGRCGHWTQIERADEFNRAVVRFIGHAPPTSR